ncbi:golgi transport complex component Cog5 like protein, partial [Zymoseptoria brevis]
MTTTTTTTTPYLDPTPFLSPTFNPFTHANTLVHSTNNPTDTPLDLTTPLQKTLFDAQEISTAIDTLTTTSALPLIAHTQLRTEAAERVLSGVEDGVGGLQRSYDRLQKEVIARWEEAERVRLAAERVVKTLRLGRKVGRVVGLGRTLEGEMGGLNVTQGGGGGMVRAARAIVEIKGEFSGEQGKELARVQVANAVKTEVVGNAEKTVVSKAQSVVREWSMNSLLSSSTSTSGQTTIPDVNNNHTYIQQESTKSRTLAALQTLYLLSPLNTPFEPSLMLTALTTYIHASLTSSLATLSRSLATLPTLDRTLLEVSARSRNLIALENLLSSAKPPAHPLLTSIPEGNLLSPLLASLDSPSSLASYFWRSLAGQLGGKVQVIVDRGGVAARTLRSQRERVKEAVRECVIRGYGG